MKTKSLIRKPQPSSRKRAGITADKSVVKDKFTFPTFTPVFSKTTSDRSILNTIFNIKILRKEDKNRFLLIKDVNRPVDHAPSQASAVQKLGILRPVVVANYKFNGKKGMYIIDGQNLYTALDKMGYDIPYLEIELQNDMDLIDAMSLVNTSAKPWTMPDYIRAWSFIHNDYKTLAKFIDLFNIEKMVVASILYGYNGVSTNISKIVRSGLFRVKNESRARSVLTYAQDVIKKAPKLDRGAVKAFTAAYLAYITQYFNRYDHDSFLKYLKEHSQMLLLANDQRTEVIDKFFNNLPK
jgi:hypothetical protein